MGKNNGISRLLCVFTVCIALISYNAYSLCFKGRKNEAEALNIPANGIFLPETQAETETLITEESKPQEQSGEGIPASTDGSVKGKVISRYISPYTAPLSYDGVYMKNSTELSVDIKELLEAKLSFKIAKDDSPQVLIVHTHTTETFMTNEADYYTEAFSSRTRESDKNMVSVGKIVAERLNSAGIKTLHDTTEHDYPNYTGSYSRAAKTINSYLKKYPSIKVVLDLHRDAVSANDTDKVKLVTEVEGKKAAQVMLVMGSQSGSVTDFPKWKENLKLAVRLQQKIEQKYPTLARPLSLMPKKYNENLTTGSLLIEFGTDVNTLEEAHYSALLVGNALAELFSELT